MNGIVNAPVPKCIRWSTQGHLYSGDVDGCVRMWDVHQGETLSVFGGHDGPINSICFSGDEQMMAVGTNTSQIFLWGCGNSKRRHERYSSSGRSMVGFGVI